MGLQNRISRMLAGGERWRRGSGARLAKRIRRFTILDEEPLLNNVLRGFKTLRVAGN
jgi:hypothetical protein